jgi:hypothetical protein
MPVIVDSGRQRTIIVSDQRVAAIRAARGRTTTVQARDNVNTVDGAPSVVAVGTRGAQGARGLQGYSGAGLIPPIAFAWGDAAGSVYAPTETGTLATVRVVVTVPFDGNGAQLMLGTAGTPDAALAAADNDLSVAGEYEVTSDLNLAMAEDLILTITPGFGASQGAGFLFLSFLPAA